MKTKLLYLLFFVGFMANAQIQAPWVNAISTTNITTNSATLNFNVNYNGSFTNYYGMYSVNLNMASPVQTGSGSVNVFGWQARTINIGGLQPNTTYYWRITATNGMGTTHSSILSFTTFGNPTLPEVSNISVANITSHSSTVNYTISPNHGATTSVIKYGLASNELTSQVAGISANGNTSSSGATIIGSLLSETTYFYQVEATNSAGTAVSSIESFTTLEAPPLEIIAQYNFDNTYNNVSGNTPFAQNAGTSFVTDRHGNGNNALNINNTGTTATIANLPYEALPRTVSLWVKINTMNGVGFNFLYSYGTNLSPEGAYINATSIIHFLPNHTASLTHNVNVWYHFVFAYDGTTSRIYRNGTLISTSNGAKNTANNSDIFRLGLSEGGAPNYFNGAIDDLKIYNYAMTETQVEDLYEEEAVLSIDSLQSTSLKIYPNPAGSVVYIDSGDLLMSRVELYSVLGKKVLETTESKISILDLSSGIYLVKIYSGNKFVTKKLVVK